jgi:hypothetical protein
MLVLFLPKTALLWDTPSKISPHIFDAAVAKDALSVFSCVEVASSFLVHIFFCVSSNSGKASA